MPLWVWAVVCLGGLAMSSAAILRRRRSNVITDLVPFDLAWQDANPTLSALGATTYSRAVVRNAAHQTLAALTPTYASGTPANVTINSAGVCTAVANGSSVITASYAGLTSITQTVTVSQVVASISGPTTFSTDDASSSTSPWATYTPKDANGNTVAGASITYGPSDANGVFQVTNSATGAWSGQGPGTANVTVSCGGVSITVVISVAHASLTITSDTSPIYIGNSFTLTVQSSGSNVTPDTLTSSDTAKVTVDPPTIGTLSPTSITQGASNVAFTLSGCTNLRQASDTFTLPSGVTLSGYTVTGGGTGATFNLSATAGATTGAGSLVIANTGHGSASTALTVTAASGSTNVTAGLSGVGFYSNDFSSYANDAALKGDTTNLSFYTTSGSYGALSSSTTYNGHNTFAQKLLNDGSQAGIGTEASTAVTWNTTAATYRATIKWTAGYTVPTSATHNLLMVYAKDTTKYSVATLNCIARLYIVNSAGTLTYKLDTVVKNAADNAFIATVQTVTIGTVGAELTNGYTIDYFLRVVQTDSTHFTVTAWLGKNVSGTVSNVMQLFAPVTRTLSVADATFYQGQFRPDGYNTQGTPATTQITYICQMEGVDETAHPDVYSLANAATTYTPLT